MQIVQSELFCDIRAKKICGIDEAGRGPLAGPVAAAAVILPDGFPVELLADSKLLSEKKRLEAFKVITSIAIWHNDWAWPSEIDSMNILNATLLAMQRAYTGLKEKADLAVIDGNRLPILPCPCKAVVKADRLIPAVMAASIVAKVCRDQLMERYDWLYPEYGYARHKGYPTAAHRAVCINLGPSPIQRASFNVKL